MVIGAINLCAVLKFNTNYVGLFSCKPYISVIVVLPIVAHYLALSAYEVGYVLESVLCQYLRISNKAMVFQGCVEVFGFMLIVEHQWYRAYELFAGVEAIETSVAVLIKLHTVMALHPSCYALVVSRLEVYAVVCCCLRYRYAC